VIMNTTVPSSQLRKKHNAIAYHRVREAIAGGIIQFAKVLSKDNYADILTKPLGRTEFLELIHPILFRQPDSFLVTNNTVKEEGAHIVCAGTVLEEKQGDDNRTDIE
jgi:hypothetical protein